MKKTLRSNLIVIFAIICLLSFIFGFSDLSILRSAFAQNDGHSKAVLTIKNATNKKDNVYYDISFDYSLSDGAPNGYYGYWGTLSGTTDEKTTIEFGTKTSNRNVAPGAVMGIARGTSTSESALVGYGFWYNNDSKSYATPGKKTKIVYDKTTSSYTHTQDGVTEPNGTDTYILPSLSSGETKNPTHTYILWIGGTYSAELTDIQVYDESGWDLGVYVSENPDMGTTTIEKYAVVGETVTIKPIFSAYEQFNAWSIKDVNGEDFELEITDNQDGTYSFVMPDEEIEITADLISLREKVSVVGIHKSHSFGYDSMKNQVTFRVEFTDLGDIIPTVSGTQVSEYFNTPEFKENFLINGSKLSKILGGNRVLNVYVGTKDTIEEEYNIESIDNSLEFVLSGTQLFDYDITIKKGCAFADNEIDETVTYRKGYDGTFSEKTIADEDVKVIAIREEPYGDTNSRALKFMFNNDASAAGELNIIFSMPVTITGGKYFCSEAEYGGRFYNLNVDAEDYKAFIKSENPLITIESKSLGDGKATVKTIFALKDGVFVEQNDTNIYEKPKVAEVRHPGNQGTNTKLFEIVFSHSLNYYIANDFELYMNGNKVSLATGYAAPEAKYDCRIFSIYISDDLRNYNGGVDVLCIKKGVPLAAGMTTTEDFYFYGVKDYDERDGAWNWKWTFSEEKPELKILKGGKASVSKDTASLTVEFDRIIDKNDLTLTNNYQIIDVSNKIKVNDKLLSEYNGASYSFTENGLTVNVNRADIVGNYLKVELIDGFTVPNGFSVSNSCSLTYGINEKIWANTFEKSNVTFKSNKISSVSPLKTIRVGGTADLPKIGLQFTIQFTDEIVGKQIRTGTRDDYNEYKNRIRWLKNVTAPYADLVEMTKLSYKGQVDYVGYEYTDEIINRFIVLGIKESVLDGILINGKTLREIAIADSSSYVENVNYPVQVDYINDKMVITVQQDSTIFEELKEGMSFSINNVLFETETKISANKVFFIENGSFVERTPVVGISVRNMKDKYYLGSDLDLSQIIVHTILSNDSQGDRVEVTADMISGYDKNTIGKQTVTITMLGYSETFEVEVIPIDVNDDESGNGCNSAVSIGGTVLGSLSMLAICLLLYARRKRSAKK